MIEAITNLSLRLSQMKLMSCTDSKVEQMFQILLDPKETDTDKKQKVPALSSHRAKCGGGSWL